MRRSAQTKTEAPIQRFYVGAALVFGLMSALMLVLAILSISGDRFDFDVLGVIRLVRNVGPLLALGMGMLLGAVSLACLMKAWWEGRARE